MIGFFVKPQTQRERNVVRFSAAVFWGGALRDDSKNGCVADYATDDWKQIQYLNIVLNNYKTGSLFLEFN